MQPSRTITIVITGASSGIGRATAQAFARRGVRLVLAARSLEGLERTAAECASRGAKTLSVPTDVTDAEAVARLARHAADAGDGHIDIWVNNAGVGAVGLFEQTPIAAHDQVVRTNLLGYLHGAHAVLPYFKRAGQGTLINTVSFGAWAPAPYGVSYSASKYGLRGFSEALRAELVPWPRIHVCDIYPSVIDSPGFRHGANYTGKMLRPPKPLYDPREVARAIVRAAANPRREATTVGVVATLVRVANAVAPKTVRRWSSRFVNTYFQQAPEVPVSDGNLFEASTGCLSVDGGWRDASSTNTLRNAGLLLGAGAVAMLLWNATRRQS
jgi:short-subunit dehydrogenase